MDYKEFLKSFQYLRKQNEVEYDSFKKLDFLANIFQKKWTLEFRTTFKVVEPLFDCEKTLLILGRGLAK